MNRWIFNYQIKVLHKSLYLVCCYHCQMFLGGKKRPGYPQIMRFEIKNVCFFFFFFLVSWVETEKLVLLNMLQNLLAIAAEMSGRQAFQSWDWYCWINDPSLCNTQEGITDWELCPIRLPIVNCNFYHMYSAQNFCNEPKPGINDVQNYF